MSKCPKKHKAKKSKSEREQEQQQEHSTPKYDSAAAWLKLNSYKNTKANLSSKLQTVSAEIHQPNLGRAASALPGIRGLRATG